MLLAMLTVAITAWAQTASTADGWIIEKSTDGTRCRLKDFNGYNGNRDNVTVYPAIIDGAAVVTISLGVEPKDFPNLETVYMYNDFALNEMPSVSSILHLESPPLKHIHVVNSSGTVVAEDAIPDVITKIPDKCFNGCAKMEKLTLPDGLKVIGSYAFYCCNTLKDIIIPDGVTDIGEYAFSDCDALTSITIPSSVTTIAAYMFYNSNKLENVTIPNSVTSIGEGAFQGCKDLTSITIPNNVTAIADYTFSGCEKLENVIIPNSVTSIGNYAFKDCKSFTSITIPTSVTSIGYYAFSGCSSLKDLYFDAPKAQWDAVTKGNSWNSDVPSDFKEHWRCTVTFETKNTSYSIPPITNMWSNWTLGNPAATLPIAGWYTDPDFTNEWHFGTDLVPGDMTLYAKWDDPCAVTASTDAPSIDIPYGQEWTDIPVTLNSLTLGWFQNAGRAVREADAVAVTPFIGTGANADFTFYDGSTTLTATKGAGTHTDGNQLSEPLTAAGQSATLWVHIPQSTWESATAGNYTGQLSYDALFISNADPAETYTYSLGSEARVTINLSIPEAATLTFLPNGGSGDAMPAINTRVGITTTLPACTFTAPEGQAFLCWNTKADGTGTRYYAGSPFVPSGSMTLYAEWGTDYVIDLTTTEVGASVSIPLGLYAQLTQLTGYYNNETDPMGLDLNLDGEKDLALVQKRDEETDQMTASVQVLTSLTENYRFVLTTPSEEGEVGSVIFRFASEGQTVEQAVIEELYDDNGTYNREQLMSLKADGQPHDLMLMGRTLYRDGYWNTLCLPFAVGSFSGTPLDGATVMELDTEGTHDGHQTGLEDGTLYLYFTPATAIEAGKPYIVKWQTTGADIVNPVFRGVTVTTGTREIENPYQNSYEDPATITVAAPTDVAFSGGKVTFKGNYDKIAFDTDNSNILFMGAENTLYWPQSGASIGAFRAYFEIADGASIKAFNLNLGDGTETGIDLSPAQGEGAPAVYDLNGRRLSGKPTQRGIYIVNGRKIVVK